MADISSLQSVQSNHEKYKDLFKNSGKNDTISTDTFFSLLMAEMSNQDPLEPTSNTEFVSADGLIILFHPMQGTLSS